MPRNNDQYPSLNSFTVVENTRPHGDEIISKQERTPKVNLLFVVGIWMPSINSRTPSVVTGHIHALI